MSRPMNIKPAGYLILYGGFLIGMGLLGYLSNPERAKTALFSGGAFGVLSIVWGVLATRGIRWSFWAAILTTALLTLAFAWRASVSWLALLDGQPGKLFAAGLITAMLAASVLMLACLLRNRKRASAPS